MCEVLGMLEAVEGATYGVTPSAKESQLCEVR